MLSLTRVGELMFNRQRLTPSTSNLGLKEDPMSMTAGNGAQIEGIHAFYLYHSSGEFSGQGYIES
jgi:hypothetical protein